MTLTRCLLNSCFATDWPAARIKCFQPHHVTPQFRCWLPRTAAAGHVQRLELELRAEGIAPALKGDAEVHTLFATLQVRSAGADELL